jgi:hypothetical protein
MAIDLRVYKGVNEVVDLSVGTLATPISAKQALDGATLTYNFSIKNVGDEISPDVFLWYEDNSASTTSYVGNALNAVGITDITGSVITVNSNISTQALASGYIVIMDGENYQLLGVDTADATTVTTLTAPTLTTATKCYVAITTPSIGIGAEWNITLTVTVLAGSNAQDVTHTIRTLY